MNRNAFIFFLLLAGCATIPVVDKPAIRAQLAAIDRSDGINAQEAVIIAQNFMLEQDNDFDWDITNPKLGEDPQKPNVWSVTFPPLEDGWGSGQRPKAEVQLVHLLPYIVYVDRKNASISVMKIEIKPRQ